MLFPILHHTVSSTSNPYDSSGLPTAVSYQTPARSITSCSHLLFTTCSHEFRSASRHRSRIGLVTMHCATMFYLLEIVIFNLLQPHFLNRFIQQGVLKSPIRSSAWVLPHYPHRNLIVELPRDLPKRTFFRLIK